MFEDHAEPDSERRRKGGFLRLGPDNLGFIEMAQDVFGCVVRLFSPLSIPIPLEIPLTTFSVGLNFLIYYNFLHHIPTIRYTKFDTIRRSHILLPKPFLPIFFFPFSKIVRNQQTSETKKPVFASILNVISNVVHKKSRSLFLSLIFASCSPSVLRG